MKIIYQNILPPRGFAAMMLFGVIFARKKYNPLSERTVNHERIHFAQAKECGGWLPFYVRYIAQWIKAGFKYSNIPMELECYANDKDKEYLKTREKFAWKRY